MQRRHLNLAHFRNLKQLKLQQPGSESAKAEATTDDTTKAPVPLPYALLIVAKPVPVDFEYTYSGALTPAAAPKITGLNEACAHS